MKTLNYNGIKMNYTSVVSTFEPLLNCNVVKLYNNGEEVANLMMTNKQLELL